MQRHRIQENLTRLMLKLQGNFDYQNEGSEADALIKDG
jgi:hypothetical protein